MEITDDQWNGNILQKVSAISSDLLCAIDGDGKFIYINATWEEVLGYNKELLHKNYLSVVSPEDKSVTREVVQAAIQGRPIKNFVNYCLHLNGKQVPVSWTATWSAEDNVLSCLGRNASDLETARQKLLEKDEWHNVVVQHGSDMVGLLNQAGDYIHVEGAITKLGYQPGHLMGCNVLHFIHPEEAGMVENALARLSEEEVVQVPDFRFRASDGEWRWIDAIVSNQLQNPAIEALVVSSRDITKRKLTTLKLAESERRFRSLFDNNPDLVIYEDREGNILDANPRFLSFLGLGKHEVLSKKLCDFVPAEAGELCASNLEKAFQGEVANFHLQFKVEPNKLVSLNVTKIPLLVNGAVIGVHSIVEDVSEAYMAQSTIQKQAETLHTIFESITDAFFMLGEDWRFKLVNSEFERVLQLKREQCVGKTIWEVFPELINSSFYHYYKKALGTGQTVKFESYLEESKIWLEVKAFPSEEGLLVYFSDITEAIIAKQEREKLSLVASRISNGVIITDPAGRIEWVNNGFTRNTGYVLEEVKGQPLSTFLEGPETDLAKAKEIEEKLQVGVPFNILVLYYRKSGERVWISMDFTPVHNEEEEITQHIVIQKDVTFRKEAEERQQEMTRDLFRQNRDLQQFTYIVSHNLRAPVANAMGLADFLTKLDKHSEMYDTSLAHLKTSVFKMDTVLRDLNLILSLRDQQDISEREVFALADIFEQVRLNFLESLSQHNGEVLVDIDPTIRLNTNRAYLYSIFYNLLSNAIKYRSEARQLQVKMQGQVCPNGGGLRIDFSDNGSGFDMAKAGSNVFKLYKRFHANTNKKGRGIGLFLVKTHVETLGGNIELKSKLDEGTQVTIQLPSEVFTGEKP